MSSIIQTVQPFSSPSRVHTVHAVWQSSSSVDDKPAVIIEGSHVTVQLSSQPTTASTQNAHTTSPLHEQEDTYDAVDAFFSVTRPVYSDRVGGTRESRHDDVPPPYPHNDVDLPKYSSCDEEAGLKEPPTLAMYLFKYGFFFPLFWFIGCILLLTPLRAPEDWERTKSAEERVELIECMRKTEVKWAKRCLICCVATDDCPFCWIGDLKR